jgi:hypothetical protein
MSPYSKFLNVPSYSEEALNWCGPATGQMILEGYPSGKCQKLQEDVNVAIQSNRTEMMWDTDPVGLGKAMAALCKPLYGWAVGANTDPARVMYLVAHYMAQISYPAAALLNTLHHNGVVPHSEHWVAVTGVVTDVDPSTNQTVNLLAVLFNDPVVPNFGDPAIPKYVSGSQWYAQFMQVNKAGSIYNGNYVVVYEPPEVSGRAIAPLEILVGRVIGPAEALRFAAKWIKEYKLNEISQFKIVSELAPSAPVLVNESRGGYYIIPYLQKTPQQTVQANIFVNAYTGDFQEIGILKPTKYLEKEKAVQTALERLGKKKATAVTAELVFPADEPSYTRYFPIWKVTADESKIHVRGVEAANKG